MVLEKALGSSIKSESLRKGEKAKNTFGHRLAKLVMVTLK